LDAYVNSQGDLVSVLPDTEITAEFQDGQVAGNAGCNNYFGPYEGSGNSLTVGLLGATQMYCASEALMAQEGEYLAALQSAASYQIKDGKLQIANADREIVLTFSVLELACASGWLQSGGSNPQPLRRVVLTLGGPGKPVSRVKMIRGARLTRRVR